MTWRIRLTRFASGHLVKQQEQVNSCGIACILMLNFKIKKGLMAAGMRAGSAISAIPLPGASYVGLTLSRSAIDMAVKSEPEVYKIYGDVVGTIYDGTSYTNCNRYPAVLAKLGLGLWNAVFVGEAGVAAAMKAAVKAGAPCIAHVVWGSGGAHFVCVDDVFSGLSGTEYAAVNDPSDAAVILTAIKDGTSIKYRDNTGTFSGWMVTRA